MAWRGSILWLAILLSACGEKSDEERPLDGGRPLHDRVDARSRKDLADQPCWRAERGRWHYSVGHCEAMVPAREMEGVWVTAFEESSFFPGVAGIPDANDPARFSREIELDDREVARLSGRAPSDPRGEAYRLTFEGRRTRDIRFDCFGLPSYAVVVDRLKSARYLGPIGPLDSSGLPARLEAESERLRGRFGKAQAEAVERCRRDRADRIETAVEDDQGSNQASPAGRSSDE